MKPPSKKTTGEIFLFTKSGIYINNIAQDIGKSDCRDDISSKVYHILIVPKPLS